LVPIVLAASIVRTPYPLLALNLLFATLGFWELRTLLKQPRALPVLTLFGLAVPFWGTEVQANRDPVQMILYACVFWVVGLIFAVSSVRKRAANSASVDLAGLWIAMPLTCLMMLHNDKMVPAHPAFLTQHCYILLLLLPLWSGDIVALLVGRKFGKHLLAPSLSPKKSWEGAIANVVACVVVSLAVIPLLGDQQRVGLHVLVGTTIGVVGQIGDLFESWMKRAVGVKDSGSILPGHGGVLDRIDSFLFAAPVVCLELIVAVALGA
jgi:phosphatidate cytidylyltransferase